MENIWIIGCGDIGRRVAKLSHNRFDTINGWVQTTDSAELCQQQGIKTIIGNITDKQYYSTLDNFSNSHIFYFIPPPRKGKKDPRLQYFLQQLKNLPKRIVLISTTGVYGDCQGKWIDETTPLNPRADRAWRRMDAEQTLQSWAKTYQREFVILRVAGIYAANRLPLKRLQKNLPMIKEKDAPWTNRIHADDLAMICVQAMQKAASGKIYNACDGHPTNMTNYFNQVADAVNLPRPPQIDLQQASQILSKGMLSYLRESRRISNQKLLKDLDICLQYPTLEIGLKY